MGAAADPPLLLSGCGDDSTGDDAPVNPPVLTIKDNALGIISVAAAGQTVSFEYEVAEPVAGKLAVARSDAEWLHDFDNEAFGKITFVADENAGEELTRTAKVTLSYPGAESVTVEVAQGERVISMDVTEVTVSSVKAKLAMKDDPAQTFLFGLVKKSDYDAIGSPEKFLEAERAKLEAEAKDSGWFDTLADYLDFLLGDWNPDDQQMNRDGLELDTEYYIYAYGIDKTGAYTTPLVRRLVRTNGLKEIDFKLGVKEIKQTTATLTGNPEDAFVYYYLGYVSKADYEGMFKQDDEQIVNNALGAIRMGIGSDGSKLPEVASVRMGEGSLEIGGLLPDTEYYALTFGIDNSVSACTKLTKQLFKTEAVAIVDDCTFEVAVTDVNSLLMNIAVKPSKATTRYFATIKATDEVKNMTPSQVADDEVAFQNGFTPPRRLDDRSARLHGRADAPLAPQSGHHDPQARDRLHGLCLRRERQGCAHHRGGDCSDADDGRRAVGDDARGQERDARGGERSQRLDGWGPKLYYFQYDVKPSVDTEYYYTGIVGKSAYEAFADDEAFMKDVVEQAGELIMMNCFMARITPD